MLIPACNQCGDIHIPLKYCEICTTNLCVKCWGGTTDDPNKEVQDWSDDTYCDQCYWDKEDQKEVK